MSTQLPAIFPPDYSEQLDGGESSSIGLSTGIGESAYDHSIMSWNRAKSMKLASIRCAKQ